MINVVDFPTRLTSHSARSLDHIYTNLHSNDVTAGPLVTNLSDHLAVRGEILTSIDSQKCEEKIVRNFSRSNCLNFIASLLSVDWGELKSRYCDCPHRTAVSVINTITNKLEICFPLKKVLCNNNKLKSWVTDDIESYRQLLFDIIEISKLSPYNESLNNLILDLNTKYDYMIQNQRAFFYTKILYNSKNTSKTMWKLINKQRGKANACNMHFTEIVKDSGGNPFPTGKDAANAMNARFVGAAAACGAPLADSARVLAALTVARAPADQELWFHPFTASEVLRIITARVPPKPSKDAYGISMKLVSMAAVPLAPVLADLFNLCLRQGTYPESLKISKVAPIFKGKGKSHDIDAYRPVSIIPAVAKVLENGLCSRLVDYLKASHALSDRQYAYREGRSTTSLTREVLRRIMHAREEKQQVAVLCCDLSKAFDVADHGILAMKLRHYGIAGKPLMLLQSMMSSRMQVVAGTCDSDTSDPLSSTIGVPQGSAVSNVLFSLLLNDLPAAISGAEIMMYADDIAAIVTAPSIDLLEGKLNGVALQISRWFKDNGLVLNLSKTNFIHFCLSGRLQRQLSVVADGVALEQVSSTTFLGFIMDKGLTWADQIEKVCGKLGGACFALNRLARFLPREVVRSCYYATVHSIIQYGAELWGRAADWERVFRMQKRAIRAIVKVSRRTSARPFFEELGIMTLPCIVVFQVAVYVRTNLDLYTRKGQVSLYKTRRAEHLVSMSYKLTKSRKLTSAMGPAVYNRIPADIADAPSLNCFKSRLKTWLIKRSFYTIEEFLKLKV